MKNIPLYYKRAYQNKRYLIKLGNSINPLNHDSTQAQNKLVFPCVWEKDIDSIFLGAFICDCYGICYLLDLNDFDNYELIHINK